MNLEIKFLKSFMAISIAISSSNISMASDLITGAGSSFIAPVIYKWSAAYYKETDSKINYQSIGSGAGIKQIENKIVDFGATDMPLTAKELDDKGLIQFPAIIGGIVIITNIAGVSQGQLILDAKTIAEIYSGQIKNWNDKRIAHLNPGLSLPDKKIIVVYRSDASGTTFNFTYYLNNASKSSWEIGFGANVSWPTGITGFGGKGNEGVTNLVKLTAGSIGYVEYSYAMQNKLAWSRMHNAEGNVVPVLEKNEFQNEKKVSEAFRKSFQAAALYAEWEKSAGMYVLLANQKGTLSWPMTASTFILIPKKSSHPKKINEVLNFFKYAYTKGDSIAESLDYISIPDKTYKLIQNKWNMEFESEKEKFAISK
jgi:phosphate transport system substrate-binding protein